MSYQKLSKHSSSSVSKEESVNYNSQDYLNQNSVIKDQRKEEDIFKMLRMGIPNENKRNSLLNYYNPSIDVNKVLNIAEFQENQIIKNLADNNVKKIVPVIEMQKKTKEDLLHEILIDRKDSLSNRDSEDSIASQEIQFKNTDKNENKNQKCLKHLPSKSEKTLSVIAHKIISNDPQNTDDANKKLIIIKPIKDNSKGKSSKEQYYKTDILNHLERKNLRNQIIKLNTHKNDNKDFQIKSKTKNSASIIDDENDKKNNQETVRIATERGNDPENSQNQDNDNYFKNTENDSRCSKSVSVKKDEERANADEKIGIVDEIKEALNLRELEKIKLSKRRKSINLMRKNQNEKRKNLEINSAAIAQLIKKDNESSANARYKRLIKWVDVIVAILVCVNITISIIDNEIYISYSDKFLTEYTNKNNITNMDLITLSKMVDRPISDEENSLRIINIIVVATNVVFIYIHYHLKIKVLQLDHKLSIYENIFTSGYYKFCLLEMLICGLFYPPYMNNVLSGTIMDLYYVYNMNALVSFFVMLKCYIILRVYSYFSRWTSAEAISVCNKYNVRSGVHFAVKAELKKRTYTMLSIMMLVSLVILSFAMRTFEYGVKDPSNSRSLKGDNDLQSLINCVWLVIVTMTTVGYGDLFPKSHLGRFIGVVACIIGMLIVSLIVVSLAVIAEFTSEEKKAYSLLKKLQADNNASNKAIKVIVGILKLRKLVYKSQPNKKSILYSNSNNNNSNNYNSNNNHMTQKNVGATNNLSERFILLTNLKKEISIFKNDYKIANSYSLPLDEMLKKLESKLKNDIRQLTQNIKKLSIVENELDKISKKQNFVREKIEVIHQRQDKIGKYIAKLNNDNFKKLIIKKYKENIYSVATQDEAQTNDYNQIEKPASESKMFAIAENEERPNIDKNQSKQDEINNESKIKEYDDKVNNKNFMFEAKCDDCINDTVDVQNSSNQVSHKNQIKISPNEGFQNDVIKAEEILQENTSHVEKIDNNEALVDNMLIKENEYCKNISSEKINTLTESQAKDINDVFINNLISFPKDAEEKKIRESKMKFDNEIIMSTNEFEKSNKKYNEIDCLIKMDNLNQMIRSNNVSSVSSSSVKKQEKDENIVYNNIVEHEAELNVENNNNKFAIDKFFY